MRLASARQLLRPWMWQLTLNQRFCGDSTSCPMCRVAFGQDWSPGELSRIFYRVYSHFCDFLQLSTLFSFVHSLSLRTADIFILHFYSLLAFSFSKKTAYTFILRFPMLTGSPAFTLLTDCPMLWMAYSFPALGATYKFSVLVSSYVFSHARYRWRIFPRFPLLTSCSWHRLHIFPRFAELINFFGACSAYKIFPPMAPYMFSYISTLRTVNTFSRTWHYLHVFTTLGTAYFFSARLTLLTYFLASGTIYTFISGLHHVSPTPQYCLSSHFRSSGVAQIMKTE